MRRFRLTTFFLCAALLATAACAAGPREREAAKLAQFERHAGASVSNFHFFRMESWETLGDDAIAVWTKINEAYLIRVHEPCHGLDFATSVAVSSSNSRVYAKFDKVLFDDQSCQIRDIRRVDVPSLKAERRGEIVPTAETNSELDEQVD